MGNTQGRGSEGKLSLKAACKTPQRLPSSVLEFESDTRALGRALHDNEISKSNA